MSRREQLERAKAEWDEVRQSPDKELRRQKVFAKSQAYAACHYDEVRGKYEMKTIEWSLQEHVLRAFNWTQTRVGGRLHGYQLLRCPRIFCPARRSNTSPPVS